MALEALRTKTTTMEKNTKKEISALRKAGRDREQDLETLNSVLQSNQDLINVRACAHAFTHLSTAGFCAIRGFTLKLCLFFRICEWLSGRRNKI